MHQPWPLAVSSLGAPELDLPAFLALAREAGCTGVELRLGADQVSPQLDTAGRTVG